MCVWQGDGVLAPKKYSIAVLPAAHDVVLKTRLFVAEIDLCEFAPPASAASGHGHEVCVGS